ncbi:Hint domain-containing protein [Acidisphaera sp. L21]|uniref:Hint domain-containing protein n=1 Tax=Acidisphaera sp. L21 TaxID=1641851 RepID=UPI00131DDBBC|nr:Hint domain-containing protein [Acidisphaera sp. L21]
MSKITTFIINTGAGSDSNWSDPSNWTNGVPANGDNVVTATSNDFVFENDDISSLSLNSITLTSGVSVLTTASVQLFIDDVIAQPTSHTSPNSVASLNATGENSFIFVDGISSQGSIPLEFAASANGASIKDRESGVGVAYSATQGGIVIVGNQPSLLDVFSLSSGGTFVFPFVTNGSQIPSFHIDMSIVGDAIELPGSSVQNISFSSNSFSITTDVLTLNFPDVTFSNGAGAPTGYKESNEPSNGLETVQFVTCYCSGTTIRTGSGEISIEDLRVGDLIQTASGAHRPVRWIGHRTINCRNHLRPEQVNPVRIGRHAFGENRPSRDLYVSPGHSICVDVLGEVLIPAGLLINGSTVAQMEVDEVTYWHIELDSHDIIIANGLPAESYLDMGNRDFFSVKKNIPGDGTSGSNVPDPATLTHADFCRPFVNGGSVLDAISIQLRRQAEKLGWTLDRSKPLGDLHLLVDGIRIDPVTRDLTARFSVPKSAREVWLVSCTARPGDVGEGRDLRQLGVRLAGLAIDDGFEMRQVIDLDDPLICAGFHHLEGSCRWTAGRALLPAELWAHCEADFFLRVDLERPALPQWVMPAALKLISSNLYSTGVTIEERRQRLG